MSPGDDLPTVEEIHTNHEEIVHEYGLTHDGIGAYFADEKLDGLLEEAREYDDEFMRAAVIFRKLPSIHVYEDGNKRTAYLTVIEYLDRHNLELARSGEIVERVLRNRKRYSIEEIAHWMETGEISDEKLRER